MLESKLEEESHSRMQKSQNRGQILSEIDFVTWLSSGFGIRGGPGGTAEMRSQWFAFGREGEGGGKFGRISWITNEERNDIKLTDFRTHNHGTNSVRQRVDGVEMKGTEKVITWRRIPSFQRIVLYEPIETYINRAFLRIFLFQVSARSLPFDTSFQFDSFSTAGKSSQDCLRYRVKCEKNFVNFCNSSNSILYAPLNERIEI